MPGSRPTRVAAAILLAAALSPAPARAAGTGSGRLRVLGETAFGPAPRTWREGQRFESAVNVLLARAPVEALCLYDRRVLPPEVVDSALATHPVAAVGGTRAASPTFQEPTRYLSGLPLPREPLEQDAPVFANWDQDETAVESRYSEQDPATVDAELVEAAGHVAGLYATVTPTTARRTGTRSNGSEFTLESLALYHLHDVVHHVHDVGA